MLFAVPGKLRAGEYIGLLFLMFPLVGVGLIYWAIVSVARARRFGQTFPVLNPFPARPGALVRGHVHAPAALGESSEAVLVAIGSGTERWLSDETLCGMLDVSEKLIHVGVS